MQLINRLYLASSSPSRAQLLREVRIPYAIIGQTADESLVSTESPVESIVSAIAQLKMEHALLPGGYQGDVIFVLTADTLGVDSEGIVYGKPVDCTDAIRMIKKLRNGARCATGFCLERKRFLNGAWHTEERITDVVSASYELDLPDEWIDRYLEHQNALQVSGALVLECYGSLFVKKIDGSFSTIRGLPLCEVRGALERLGFSAF